MKTGTQLTKPLDAQLFEQLLAVAYQRQQRRIEPIALVPPSNVPASVAPPSADKRFMKEDGRLAAIAEAHTLVQGSQLRLQETLQLVTDRAVSITGGSGAAIWLLRESNTVCQAAGGASADHVGLAIPVEGSRLEPCLRDGLVFRCDDLQADRRTRGDARARGVEGSLVAVPILYEGQVQGALEVTFARPSAFEEADVRTCQILGGLISQTVAEAVGKARKNILDSERATLLEALERIQPHLSKLLSDSAAADAAESSPVLSSLSLPPVPAQPLSSAGAGSAARSMAGPTPGIARLGKYLISQQEAGALESAGIAQKAEPRDVQTALSYSVSSKRPARNPHSGQPRVSPGNFHSAELEPDPEEESLEESSMDEGDDVPDIPQGLLGPVSSLRATQYVTEHVEDEATELARHETPWLAAETELEAESETETRPEAEEESYAANPGPAPFLRSHWADLCLAVSVVALAASLTWAFWPRSKPSMAAAHSAVGTENTPGSTPQLTAFEQLLVNLGIAEAPPPPAVYTGTPGVKVWVDLHSALYYCAGAEPYGQTPKGKFLTQHDAQAEQYQPARGQPCD